MDRGGGAGWFVGRGVELRRLATSLADVRAGRALTILIEGDAGIGKSALLNEFIEQSDVAAILSATGDEAERDLAWGVMDQLLSGTGRPSARSDPRRADPLAIGASLVTALADLAAAEPIAVVVDDAHWADAVSMQALTFALRRLKTDAVLTLIASRSRTVLPDGFNRLLAGDQGHVVKVPRFSEQDTVELARLVSDIELGRPAAARLVRHTGGNPLYLRAILDEVDSAELANPEGDLPVPRSFALLILSRLAACSPKARALVGAAAVHGLRSSLALIAAVAGLDDAPAAIDEACAAGIVDSRAARSGEAVFTHPLVRAAIYEDLSVAARTGLHRTLADHVSGAAALRHRVAASVGPDETLAADLSRAATGDLIDGAPVAAADHLIAAARMTTSLELREQILVDATRALLLSGDSTRAGALTAAVSELRQSGRRDAALGFLMILSGDRRSAKARLEAAFAALIPHNEPNLVAQISVEQAQLAVLEGRRDEAEQWAWRAFEAGTGDGSLVAGMRSRLMTVLAQSGRPTDALAVVADLPETAAPHNMDQMDALMGRAMTRLWTDDLKGAHRDLLTVTALLQQGGVLRDAVIAQTYLAEVEYRLGDWDDSVVNAHRAVSVCIDSEQHQMSSLVHAIAVLALAARGDWAAAEDHVRAATAAVTPFDPDNTANVAYAAGSAAHLAFARADAAGVVTAVDPILRLHRRGGADQPGVIAWAELYAWALVELGRLDDANTLLVRLEATASEQQHCSVLAALASVRGRWHAARGEMTEARRTFESGRAHAARVPSPFGSALVADAYGRALRRSGDRRAAAGHLQAARSTYRELGAEPFRERAERELAACGLAPFRRSVAQPLRLTPQELAVARLAAGGRTNREVAVELVVSVKTIEYHLANAFAKLGIRSRRELAAALAAAATD